MIFKTQNSILSLEKLLSLKSPHKTSGAKANNLLQNRWITRVRLKWVKNRGLDHIIDIDTDLKAACLLKDAIKRASTGFLTANSVSDWHKLLGLTVPVIRFLRRYPTLFHEFPHSRYANLPCFRLTDTALLLDSLEQKIHLTYENDTMERLCRVLMMMRTRTAPLQSLHSLKWDLGLQLSRWREEFAVSELEKSNEKSEMGNEYRQFKSGQTILAFPMNFPRRYGAQKKVSVWMDEFQKLPYISPYDDSRNIDPNSDLMEKRAVGILHELLSLTIHKKTKRNYLRSLREELNLPHKFTRLFTRYPGIFYLSLKCKTTTVTLKEGYQRGKLVNPHPLVNLRKKFYHVMRTGLLYRAKGVNMIPPLDISLDDNIENEIEQKETEEEETGTDDECYEETSELEDESDEE